VLPRGAAEQVTKRVDMSELILPQAVSFDLGKVHPAPEHRAFGADLISRNLMQLPYPACWFRCGPEDDERDDHQYYLVYQFKVPPPPDIIDGMAKVMRAKGLPADRIAGAVKRAGEIKAMQMNITRYLGMREGPDPGAILPIMTVRAEGDIDPVTGKPGIAFDWWAVMNDISKDEREKARMPLITNSTRKDWEDEAIYALGTIGGIMSMLMSKDVQKIRHEAPAKVNKIRLKKGKPLITDSFEVKIRSYTAGNGIARGPLTGERKSPKTHWRRGHMRRHRSDHSKWIPIAPMLVNADDEVVQLPKDYVVIESEMPSMKGVRIYA
jgi:hypothetical protein